ncbi:MAG: lamin tail domain-containing protein [Bacteroidales bacterium]|nr:lamin tail domain-containing protein [Bacteroidales bacterium]
MTYSNKILPIIAIIFISKNIFAQVSIINIESMYNGVGGMNGDAIADWEVNDRFENDQLFMSGTGDVRNTFPSDYPAASGSWNIMLNTVGENFQVSGIDASVYLDLTIKFGIRKSTTAEDGSGISFEYSPDGITWINLSIVLPSGSGTAGWHEVQAAGFLPSSITALRFTSIGPTEFRLDDLRLEGILPCAIQVDSVYPLNGPAGTLLDIFGTGFTGASQVSINSIPAGYFQVESDELITARVAEGSGNGIVQVTGTCLSMGSAYFQTLTESCALNGGNLIISELCDPVNSFQSDRYIEIFNPTSHSINLGGWTVKAIANFAECETWNLLGSIEPGEAKTCGYSNPVFGGPHDFVDSSWLGSIPGSCCNSWNGNRRDGAVLYNGSVKIDQVIYENSSIPWFADGSLVRADSICSPDSTGSNEGWEVLAPVIQSGQVPSSPGIHHTACTGNSPVINQQPDTQWVCEGNQVIYEVSVSGGVPPYTYKWMKLDISGNWNIIPEIYPFSMISGETTSSLEISNVTIAMDGEQFYCRVYNQGEGCWKAGWAAQLWVQPIPLTSNIFHY